MEKDGDLSAVQLRMSITFRRKSKEQDRAMLVLEVQVASWRRIHIVDAQRAITVAQTSTHCFMLYERRSNRIHLVSG
jgi:hypothetical protein